MKKPYYKTDASVEEYIHLAKDVSGIQIIEKLKEVLPINSTVLEIGSGPGTDLKILSKSYMVTGSDFSEQFLSRLQTKYPKCDFLELDAVTLQTDKTFDAIYSNKVLHHLTDEELAKSIKRQLNCLKPNGIICHSFWKGEGSEIFKGLFVKYHIKSTLRGFFEEYYEIVLLEDYKEFEDNDSLLLIAKKR